MPTLHKILICRKHTEQLQNGIYKLCRIKLKNSYQNKFQKTSNCENSYNTETMYL